MKPFIKSRCLWKQKAPVSITPTWRSQFVCGPECCLKEGPGRMSTAAAWREDTGQQDSLKGKNWPPLKSLKDAFSVRRLASPPISDPGDGALRQGHHSQAGPVSPASLSYWMFHFPPHMAASNSQTAGLPSWDAWSRAPLGVDTPHPLAKPDSTEPPLLRASPQGPPGPVSWLMSCLFRADLIESLRIRLCGVKT